MEYVIGAIVAGAALAVLLAARWAHSRPQAAAEPGAWEAQKGRWAPWLWLGFLLILVGLGLFSWYVTRQGMWGLAVLAPILLAATLLSMFRRGEIFRHQAWARWTRLGLSLLLAAAALLGWSLGGSRPAEPPQTQLAPQVWLYYYSPALDTDEDGNVYCSPEAVRAVRRTLPAGTADVIGGTIQLLIAGQLTAAERQAGLATEFPLPGLALSSSTLEGGVLTLTFSDPQLKTSGGSCRVGILWGQIAATAKQFPGVREVRFMPEELFQP